MRRQIDRLIKQVEKPSTAVADAVHDLRKFHKRARAMLRLVRPTAPEVYRAENAWFRDQARAFSGTRDRDVLGATFDGLLERAGKAGVAVPEGLDSVRSAMLDSMDAPPSHRNADGIRAAVVADLREARARVAGWRMTSGSYAPLLAGAAATYGAGRRAMDRAYPAGEAMHFHEWRKQVKYHRHQMEFLEGLWPKVFSVIAGELSDLGEGLGDHQDLMVLRQRLAGVTMVDEDEALTRWCLYQTDAAARELRARSWFVGRRLFADRRKSFRHRLECCAESITARGFE